MNFYKTEIKRGLELSAFNKTKMTTEITSKDVFKGTKSFMFFSVLFPVLVG